MEWTPALSLCTGIWYGHDVRYQTSNPRTGQLSEKLTSPADYLSLLYTVPPTSNTPAQTTHASTSLPEHRKGEKEARSISDTFQHRQEAPRPQLHLGRGIFLASEVLFRTTKVLGRIRERFLVSTLLYVWEGGNPKIGSMMVSCAPLHPVPSSPAVQRYFRTLSSSSDGTQQTHQRTPTQKDVAHLRFATNCSCACQLQTEIFSKTPSWQAKILPKPSHREIAPTWSKSQKWQTQLCFLFWKLPKTEV